LEIRYEVVPSTISSRNIVRVALDFEKTLNSLTFEMLSDLRAKLLEWHGDPEISAVFLEGSRDKAFSAGGNVKKLRSEILSTQKDITLKEKFAFRFFLLEYSTDFLIYQYRKPIIAWTHGITMGGGLGLMQGAPFRFATPETQMAMPEIFIGLYPDVGASLFLNKMKIPGLGLFMALTGTKLQGRDNLLSGLATHFEANSNRDDFFNALLEVDFGQNPQIVQKQFQGESNDSVLKPDVLQRLKEWDKAESIFDLISDWGSHYSLLSDWEKDSIDNLKMGSPLSLRVTFQRMKEAQRLVDTQNFDVIDFFEKDLAMSTQFAERSDFIEGVRARLIDKDNQPTWCFPRLEDIEHEDLDFYFQNPFNGETPLREEVKKLGIII
jgi:enoyl-CoA hydratase/carnithine racemase